MREEVYNTGFETLKLGTDEYCTILDQFNTSQVKVNKLMPLMATGKPKDSPYTLPHKITCNDPACAPVGKKKCISKNYMTIKGRVYEVYPGDIGRIRIVNGNINKIEFVGKK